MVVEKEEEEGETETAFDVLEVHEVACGLRQQLALSPLCVCWAQIWTLNVLWDGSVTQV